MCQMSDDDPRVQLGKLIEEGALGLYTLIAVFGTARNAMKVLSGQGHLTPCMTQRLHFYCDIDLDATGED
jgi:hypothetical protein